MKLAALIEKFSRLGRPRVVLVGDFMLDEYVYGDVERINPEAPVPVLRTVRTEQRLGGAGRVAADLATLGAEVMCVGMIGEDPAGRQVRAQLAELGCDSECMVVAHDRPTTQKTRLIGLAQHRHAQQLLRIDREQTGPADADTRGRLQSSALTCLAGADVLLLQDYNKGVLAGELIATLVAEARRRHIPVLVDPALVADYSRYRGATLITPNRYEASLAAGEQIRELARDQTGQPDLAQLARVGQALVERAELDAVVITLDKEGIYLHRRDGGGELIPTRPRQIYDVTGAGDMVLAVLGLCWPSGFSPAEAVAMSNMAAGLEVEKFGSVPITRGELLSELHAARRGKSKLWPLGELVAEVERLRSAGRTIAFTNGCFDILHPGHVNYLQFARDQGDVLIVGLNSDASVRRNKGPTRPINSQDSRAAVLSGLACVDYVVFFDEDTPFELVRAIQPDRLIKGRQWEGNVVGTDIVEARGGKVVLAEMVQGESTTTIIERAVAAQRQEQTGGESRPDR